MLVGRALAGLDVVEEVAVVLVTADRPVRGEGGAAVAADDSEVGIDDADPGARRRAALFSRGTLLVSSDVRLDGDRYHIR